MAEREAKRLRKLLIVTLIFTTLLMFFTIVMDALESQFQNSTFYFSESVLFSSFWLIFVPLLYLQSVRAARCRTTAKKATLIFLPVVVHLFTFPLLVLLLSYLYYYHTFSFLQTFKYGLTTHFFTVVLVYSLPISIYKFYDSKARYSKIHLSVERISEPVSSLIVTEGRRRIKILVSNIQYFSANPPYINIHHGTKKHLSNETLRSVYSQIDGGIFVQIHKSTIVNIMHVKYYLSRHNGDYDLVMNDETVLRVSRNYAREFKTKFRARNPVTAQSNRVAAY